MAKKVHITRTFGPIHFEDLDPHRFEDLVRELIYDFRDWQSIEATGRAGSDEGFDVRAYERQAARVEDSADGDETLHPMEGNRWMIQGKREKEVGPAALRQILSEIDEKAPPYGYVLAASAVFSKDSFDVFRELLRAKGVMEFYLWGRPELEDMLHLPKNDRILFTFFGISLTSRRRSRTTEVRTLVNTKNKLMKVLGPAGQQFNTNVLLRDINDEHYPYRGEYVDFEKKPRWLQRTAFEQHPLGFIVHARRYYAFVDRHKKEWDFTREVDLLWDRNEDDDERKAWHEKRARVKEIWAYLPRSQQGEFAIDGTVRYSNVFLVDPEGDGHYRCPHVYVEFTPEHGPYDNTYVALTVGHEPFDIEDGWTRIDFFPKKFPPLKSKPRVPKKKKIDLDPDTLKGVLKYGDDSNTLYALDAKYDGLSPRDVIQIADTPETEQHFLRVMHVGHMRLEDHLADHAERYKVRQHLRQQVGREVEPIEMLTILETERAYPHEWERRDKPD